MRSTRPRSSSFPAGVLSYQRSTRRRATVLTAMILLSLCVATASWSQAFLPAGPGFKPKDFTILRDGPWYQAFYIETIANDRSDTGTRIGHSRSLDLWHWEYLDSNFGPGSAPFDNQRVWAPHLVKVSGVYYLFYTGVSSDPTTPNHQSIGVATSNDLISWNRLSAPIMDCSIAANSKCTPNSAGGQLRDPFAMPDPTTPGRWVTYYATVSDDSAFMATGMATTSSALTTTPWSDAGVTWTPTSTAPFDTRFIESPHLFYHDGLWYLLYTAGTPFPSDLITVWTNAVAPIGAEGSWLKRGTLNVVLGYSNFYWFASEKFDDVDGNEYFGVVSDPWDTRQIQIYKMTWTPGNWKFGLVNPPAGITAIHWDTQSGTNWVTVGQYANLVFTSGAFQGRQAHIEILEHDPGQPDQILSPASLGFPTGDIDLNGTTTAFHWTAQAFPDDDATPDRLEVEVRLKNDPSMTSGTLYITTPGGGHDPFEIDARARQMTPDRESGGTPTTPEVTLRALKETPLGPGIGLLVDLPAESQARVEIFDLSGRRLRTVSSGVMGKGATVLLWDGRDDAGRLAPPGVVFARLTTPKEVRTARLVLGAGMR